MHHGRLPTGDGPVPGVALRARAHGVGLTGRGHDVLYATRSRDQLSMNSPSGLTVLTFDGQAELKTLAQRAGADVILAVAPDELPALAEVGVPVVADLYAPRILEAQFQSNDVSSEVARVLDAMALADGFLVTTERQRYYTLGLLPLAGVDCREDRVAVVPLSAPRSPGRRSRSKTPSLVAGGVKWPWQDPSWAVTNTLAELEATNLGVLNVFGGAYPLAEAEDWPKGETDRADSAHLKHHTLVGYSSWLKHCLGAWAALDVMAPNPERSLALAFRQMDWLGCGVPLITGSYAPIASDIVAFEAGWVVEPGDTEGLRCALSQALGDKSIQRARSQGARKLAKTKFDVDGAAVQLERFLSGLTPRTRLATAWSSLARAKGEGEQLKVEHNRVIRQASTLGDDLVKKQGEVDLLGAQVRALITSVGTLGEALEGALHLKNQTLDRLTQERDEGSLEGAALQREVEVLRRDLAKKDRALNAEALEREQLKAEVGIAADRLRAAEERLDEANNRLESQANAALRASERHQSIKAEVDALSADCAKKSEELADLLADKERLRQALEAEIKLAKADAEGWKAISQERKQDIEKKNQELETLHADLDRQEDTISLLKGRLEELGGALSLRVSQALGGLLRGKG